MSRVSLPLVAWPEGDRTTWEAALAAAARGRIGRRGPAAHLRRRSWEHYREAYGAWLSVLLGDGDLEPAALPETRVTPERLDRFVEVMLERGNRGTSIKSRLVGLWRALSILAPGADLRWILAPGGVALRDVLDIAPRPKRPRAARDLFGWGMELLRTADQPASPYARAVRLRDGLIIALLAARGMRVGELHKLVLGQTLFRPPGSRRWRMEWAPAQRKAGGILDYWVPEALEPFVERYLGEARPLLLRGASSGAFWVSWRGTPMAVASLQWVVRRRSGREFGEGCEFGPHSFRHALTTSTAMEAPEHAGIAASILGHSAAVSESHYNWAGTVQAATAYGGVLDQLGRASEHELARRVNPGPVDEAENEEDA